MDDRFNTIAGWALFSGIVGWGLSSVSAHYFDADKNHRPHKMGYAIEGVVSSEGGAAKDPRPLRRLEEVRLIGKEDSDDVAPPPDSHRGLRRG